MTRFWRILMVALMLLLQPITMVKAGSPQRPITQTESDYTQQAQQLLAQMTPAERVGQLFLVTFGGIDTGPNSDIYDLVANHYIGGVVIQAANNNITGNTINDNSVPQQVINLTSTLQELALTGQITASTPIATQATPLPAITPTAGPLPPPRTAIPLFISTEHTGNTTNIKGGLTPIPSQMAIGATWQPAQAQAVGDIVGRELEALGINMLFGPSLDLLIDPQNQMAAELGTKIFGGDPYWVSQMGTAYINGVKTGSSGRMAVIPTHFPGIGSSNRPNYSEIATVRRSLDELQDNELIPFTAVTASSTTPADGLLTAHIRYQGLQGNILPSTAPFSFDPQALETLLQTETLAQWHANGGLIVSDALGVQGIELFYDDSRQEFPHRQVAKDAFLAGNDLLYTAEFALGEQDFALQSANIRDTIAWFEEKYVTDPAFQMRVDEAVLRILQLKLELYGGDFSPDNIIHTETDLGERLNQGESIIFNLAQSALTLLAPTTEELLERLPGPPGADDNIVMFTDVQRARQCATCVVEALISETAIEERILALYGPAGSGQIQPEQLASFSLADLQTFLNTPLPIAPSPTPEAAALTPTPDPDTIPTDEVVLPTPSPTPSPAFQVQQALTEADWVIFSLLDVVSDTPSTALSELLAQRPDLLRGKRVIVYAFGAPIYLDATEVSKISAYFGVYSTGESFIDAAVQVLFRDLPLRGAAPISVPSVGYDLQTATEPDPSQIIPLTLQNEEVDEMLLGEEPLALIPGATLRLQTGVILDRNGRPVPDGTIVQFIQQDRIQGFFNVIAEVPTQAGVASYDYILEARTGQFRIRVTAGEAAASEVVDIAIGEDVSIVVASPTPEPTNTPTPTPTITPSPIPTATNTPIPLPVEPAPADPTFQLDVSLAQLQMLGAMLAGLLTIVLIAGILGQHKRPHRQQRLNLLLWGLLGALIVYNYFALELPQSELLRDFDAWAGLITTLIGGLLGILIRLINQYLQNRSRN